MHAAVSVDFLDTDSQDELDIKPSYVAPVPFDEAGRNATEAILPSQEEAEDPALHALCELTNTLLKVPMTGEPYTSRLGARQVARERLLVDCCCTAQKSWQPAALRSAASTLKPPG